MSQLVHRIWQPRSWRSSTSPRNAALRSTHSSSPGSPRERVRSSAASRRCWERFRAAIACWSASCRGSGRSLSQVIGQGSLEGLNCQDPGRLPFRPLPLHRDAQDRARLTRKPAWDSPRPYVVFQHQSGRYPYGQEAQFIEEMFTGTDTSDFVGSVRCTSPTRDRFTGVAVELDAGNRIFTTLPVVPMEREREMAPECRPQLACP